MGSEAEKTTGFDDMDWGQFERLIAQEAHTINGQRERMELIERLIDERWNSWRSAVRNRLKTEGKRDRELEEAVEGEIQPMRISHINLADGRYNLLVEKGDEWPDDEDRDPAKAGYNIMIPAHIDTVYGDADMLKIRRDPNIPDRITGLGVYDMGAAVLNNIDFAARLNVPKGMRACIVFTVDEEMHSQGARELIVQWEHWSKINAVLSSEIGPLPPRKSGEPPSLIIARAGRHKFTGTIDIDRRSSGHGSLSGVPSASRATVEMLWKLERRFYDGWKAGAESEPPFQQDHPFLGKEEFEMGEIVTTKQKGYFPTNQGEFGFAVKTVPPSTLELRRQEFQRTAKGIAKAGNWSKFGIRHSINVDPGEASYDPYAMPHDHRMVHIALDVMNRIYGTTPQLVGAPSVADECDFAASMLRRMPNGTFRDTDNGVITVPYNGGHAHHPDEWVSEFDVLLVRRAIQELINHPAGFRLLLPKT